MKLSERLSTVASFVRPGSSIADIGTDHGYVPIALCEAGVIKHGLAMDVRTGPLERAAEHIRQHGLEEKLETRLSDGVKELKAGEADTVIVAGMGGELVIHILEGGRNLWDEVEHWVLSPQSDLDKVRNFLSEHGFSIEREEMLSEDGKYYTVMEVSRGQMETLTPWESLYGPCLIKEKNSVLAAYLEKEAALLAGLLEDLKKQEGDRAKKRAEELTRQAFLDQGGAA